jgi:hypothetical protein
MSIATCISIAAELKSLTNYRGHLLSQMRAIAHSDDTDLIESTRRYLFENRVEIETWTKALYLASRDARGHFEVRL